MKLIINNLKMNFTLDEVINYERILSNIITPNELVVCPSYPYLSIFTGDNYKLGSQNVASSEVESLTGEVSAKQLKSLGVDYTIIGHVERKIYLRENLTDINNKLKILLKYHIIPILCISTEKNDSNYQIDIIRELDELFDGINEFDNVVIAYEPRWSIGTGIIPDSDYIFLVITTIKNWFVDKYNKKIKVIYGGSVDRSNIDCLEKINNIDGYLLGNCSLDINNFKLVLGGIE